MTTPLIAKDIVNLLATRHREDVFVPECKDGPSSTGLGRLDAWVMKKAWTHPLMTGYEVKVTRADFLRDDKWPKYLPLCHQLYFVTPWGLVQPDEVPEVAGLMWVTKTGGRLHTKRKAQHRDIEPPANLLMYLLMARVRIKREYEATSKQEFWQRWLQEAEEDKVFGRHVRAQVSQAVRGRIDAAERRARIAEEHAKDLADVAAELQALGISPRHFNAAGLAAERLSGQVPEHITRQIDHLAKDIDRLKMAIETHNTGADALRKIA